MLLEARVAHPTTEKEAAQLARELYGLQATAVSLPGEYDDNFLLTLTEPAASKNGGEAPLAQTVNRFVLKVMHPAREPSFIDLQCRALQHLAQRAPQLTLARVRSTLAGESFTAVTSPSGQKRLAWLLTYVPGKVLAEARPHSRELLRSLGRFLGEMSVALADFEHPAAHRELKWDLARAQWIRGHLLHIRDTSRRALVEKFLASYEAEVVPVADQLRRSIVYGDANDYNVLVGEALPLPRKVVSVIDFGDMHHSFTVSELDIAAAYAILGKTEPLQAAAVVIAGYHSAFPLSEQEISVLYPLIAARLAVSVTNSAQRATVKPDDP